MFKGTRGSPGWMCGCDVELMTKGDGEEDGVGMCVTFELVFFGRRWIWIFER